MQIEPFKPSRLSPTGLITAICVAEIFSMIGVATFPALLPTFISEWQLSNTDAGWINGIYFAGYLSAVPVLVSLTDRVSPRRIYYLCLLLAALSSAGFAFLTDGFWTAMLFRAISGIALAGSYMPGLKLLSDHLKATTGNDDQSRAVAFYTSSFGIGTAASYYLAGVIATGWDWHWAFALTAVAPLIAIAISSMALPARDPAMGDTPDTHLLDFRPVLRCRAAMGYVLAYTAHNFELFALRSWIVAYLVFAAATGPQDGFLTLEIWSATAIAASINLLGMPSSVLGNELSRRIGRHRTITIVMLSSAVMACLLGFSAEWPFWIVIALAMVYGITVTGDSASITAGVVAAAPEGYRGATMAVHSCIGFMGSFAGPLMFGVMLDLTSPDGIGGETVASWGWAFAFTGAVVALGPLALALLRERKKPG
ncbi:MAG: MFS transporter [Rhodospirillales bacterium]|nr:MFS transporter [Alphaproteobacteria bacterium]MBL6947175.1 MFS transporter [Rhodospirillales bacterium]